MIIQWDELGTFDFMIFRVSFITYETQHTERLSYVCVRMTRECTTSCVGLIPIWRYGNSRTAGVTSCLCVAVDIGHTPLVEISLLFICG